MSNITASASPTLQTSVQLVLTEVTAIKTGVSSYLLVECLVIGKFSDCVDNFLAEHTLFQEYSLSSSFCLPQYSCEQLDLTYQLSLTSPIRTGSIYQVVKESNPDLEVLWR